jgi:uncharacterized protein YecE (DUF72 family)
MQKPESQKGLPDLTIPVRVGTMGWGYSDWNGVFYPVKVNPKESIRLYAEAFDAVEIDSTFYGTPREAQILHWRDATPASFLFCPKVPRLITHEMSLKEVEPELRKFVQTMSLLEAKRGPMLIQMPPGFTRAELPALRAFLPLLAQLDDPTARFAIEFRHRSLIGPDVSALLAEHNVALACADYAGMPRRLELTSDFLYLRLIGRHGAYEHHREAQADRTSDLERWARALISQQEHMTCAYVFCNNDYEGYSPTTCNRLKTLLGLSTVERPPKIQGTLF